MKWPWVSRRAYENLERDRNVLLRLLDENRRETSELMDRLLSMQREGFTAAPRYPAPEPVQPLAPEIQTAFDALQLPGAQEAQMRGWVERQIAKGREAKQVAAELLAGGLGEPELM